MRRRLEKRLGLSWFRVSFFSPLLQRWPSKSKVASYEMQKAVLLGACSSTSTSEMIKLVFHTCLFESNWKIWYFIFSFVYCFLFLADIGFWGIYLLKTRPMVTHRNAGGSITHQVASLKPGAGWYWQTPWWPGSFHSSTKDCLEKSLVYLGKCNTLNTDTETQYIQIHIE